MRNYASANTICQMLSEETANVFLEIFTQPFPGFGASHRNHPAKRLDGLQYSELFHEEPAD